MSLMSHYWTRSTDDYIFFTTTILSSILDDLGGKHSNGASQSPSFPPSAFIRIMQGARSVKNFFSVLAAHLDFYSGTNGFIEVSLLTSLWRVAALGTHPIHAEALAEHRNSAPLWTSIFSLLQRCGSDEEQPIRDGFDADFISIIIPLTTHVANTFEHCGKTCSVQECIDLVGRWVAADMFRALDVIIPYCACRALSCSSTISPLPISISDV
jgi:hypothetical protein